MQRKNPTKNQQQLKGHFGKTRASVFLVRVIFKLMQFHMRGLILGFEHFGITNFKTATSYCGRNSWNVGHQLGGLNKKSHPEAGESQHLLGSQHAVVANEALVRDPRT